jgi:hypothetical protein
MPSQPRAVVTAKSDGTVDDTRRREQLLDDALTNTFPASDPFEISMPMTEEKELGRPARQPIRGLA